MSSNNSSPCVSKALQQKDVTQSFIFNHRAMREEVKPGTERCVPAVLLQPGSQVDPAGLVQVQLVLCNQVGAVHTWGVSIIMVRVMIMMVDVFGN